MEKVKLQKRGKRKKIENGNCEMDYGGNTYGRILFDEMTDKVFYIDGYKSKKINVYNNYDNFL